ncbi:MAG TPA: hypothetical protein VKG02_22035, partial [Blastocatellia bacterium]|nr:hypothetical protein [Blastocatellia bacterium]
MNERTSQRQKLELRAGLFALCMTTNEADLKRAGAIIRKMNAQERQAVRAGLQQLSYLMDDIFFD